MADRPKNYDPKEIEPRWYAEWMARGYFHADAAAPKAPFAIVIPPPNVTGSLHMGHALGDTHPGHPHPLAADARRTTRMWLPGTDHAGIATQMVVERELRENEKQDPPRPRPRGVRRAGLGVEGAVRRPDPRAAQACWAARSTGTATRFTMDPTCSRAVREAFVRLYEEGLIYRAQAAHQLVPVVPHGAVATSRSTRRGDAGRAVRVRVPAGGRLGRDRRRDDAARDDARRHGGGRAPRRPALPGADRQDGRRCRSSDREIPIIADAILVDPKFGTGAVKVTPAHDSNDFETGQRHKLPMISILDDDGHGQRRGRPVRRPGPLRGAQGGQGEARRSWASSAAASRTCTPSATASAATPSSSRCSRRSGS